MVKMGFRVGPYGKIVTCVFTFNYFTIIIILKIAIGRVVLILKSIKMKLIIVNPYFLRNNSIYTVVLHKYYSCCYYFKRAIYFVDHSVAIL